MLPVLNKPALAVAVLLGGALAGPALADVKTGVDAWSRGDYAAAVREWEGPAGAGDPDAMFNLAQAYRLGRGVPADLPRAERLYAQAAAAGHLQAADTYGLMLFQDGRRAAALPYIEDAARRGDARSQYLLGVAHFNGDLVEKDWVRAYALLILANDAALPQAGPAIAEMDRHIPLVQRQQAAGLAIQLRNDADATRAQELAAADLGPSLAAAETPPRPVPRATSTPAVPRPIPTVAVSPSVAAARAAVAEASRATGTESPADAGASFARGGSGDAVAAAPPVVVARSDPPAQRPVPVAVGRNDPPAERSAPVVVARSDPPAQRPAPVVVARSDPPAPRPAAATGPWRIQLGAFSVAGNAEQLWRRLSGRAELAGMQRLLVPAGRVTKLQAGGYASRAAADTACRSLKQAGHDCLVTQR